MTLPLWEHWDRKALLGPGRDDVSLDPELIYEILTSTTERKPVDTPELQRIAEIIADKERAKTDADEELLDALHAAQEAGHDLTEIGRAIGSTSAQPRVAAFKRIQSLELARRERERLAKLEANSE